MLNKKGSAYLFFFFAIFMTLMGIFLIGQVYNEKQDTTAAIGETQVNLFDLYYRSEQDVLELQAKTRFILFDVLQEYSTNGGFAQGNLCDRGDGVTIWQQGNCFPDLKNNFVELVKSKFLVKGISYESVDLSDNGLVIDFGKKTYNRDLEKSSLIYTRSLIVKEPVSLDLDSLQILQDQILFAQNSKDYRQLLDKGFVKGQYMEFSIENDKKVLTFAIGEGFKAERPVFRFAIPFVT